jgi:anti-anti-sigma factor
MNNSEDLQSCRYELSHGDDGVVTLHIQGRMDAATAAETIAGIKSILPPPLPPALTVDLKKVSYLDDFGALVLVELKNLMAGQKSRLYLKNADQRVKVYFYFYRVGLLILDPCVFAPPIVASR